MLQLAPQTFNKFIYFLKSDQNCFWQAKVQILQLTVLYFLFFEVIFDIFHTFPCKNSFLSF